MRTYIVCMSSTYIPYIPQNSSHGLPTPPPARRPPLAFFESDASSLRASPRRAIDPLFVASTSAGSTISNTSYIVSDDKQKSKSSVRPGMMCNVPYAGLVRTSQQRMQRSVLRHSREPKKCMLALGPLSILPAESDLTHRRIVAPQSYNIAWSLLVRPFAWISPNNNIGLGHNLGFNERHSHLMSSSDPRGCPPAAPHR